MTAFEMRFWNLLRDIAILLMDIRTLVAFGLNRKGHW